MATDRILRAICDACGATAEFTFDDLLGREFVQEPWRDVAILSFIDMARGHACSDDCEIVVREALKASLRAQLEADMKKVEVRA